MKPVFILVVEDNPTGRKLIRVALELEGFQVMEAGDGFSALAQMRSKLPDLIVQDLKLPDMNGLELTRLLREIAGNTRIPIIALSGFRLSLEDARGEPIPYDDYLFKPIQPSHLIEVIRKLIPGEDSEVAGKEPGAGKRILIVDDDPMQIKLMKLRLHQLGFEVASAPNAGEGLKAAESAPPDLILSDILMPDIDGFKFCMTVRRHPTLAHVPIILMSTHYRQDLDTKLAKDAGANDLVMRTPDSGNVIEAICRTLQSEATQAAARRDPEALAEDHLSRVSNQLQQQVAANAALAEKCALQSAQISIIGGVADALVKSVSLGRTLYEVLSSCLDAGGVSKGAIYRLDAAGKLVVFRAVGFSDSETFHLQDAFGYGKLLEQVVSGKPVLLSQHMSTTGVAIFCSRSGIRSAVLIPIFSASRCSGALLLGSIATDVVEADILAFGRAISGYFGQALELETSFEALRQNQAEFQTLANSVSQLVWMADADGALFWYNQRWYDYTGTEPEQMLGWGWQSVHDPLALPTILERWLLSLKSGEPFEMTFPLRGSDGLFRPFLTRVIPMHDGNGKVVRWFGTNTDVSAQIHNEEELRQSQERLHAALIASDTGTFQWDPIADKFLVFDENLRTLFGLSPEEHVSTTEDFIARVHPGDRSAVRSATEACRNGADFELEYRIVLGSGDVRWLYGRGRMDRGIGRGAYLVGAATDISHRKQGEEVRQRLAAIVQSSDDAIISKDLNGIVVSWNAGAEAMFGYTADEMMGQSLRLIVPPELRENEREFLETIAAGQSVHHFQTVRIRRDNQRIDVLLTFCPVKDEAGQIIGSAEIARDITQLKTAERAMVTTEKLASVGRMAATMAHEINNPLEAVTNLIYLARTCTDPELIRKHLLLAEEELARVALLTKQTLSFYRDTRGIASTKVGSLLTELLPVFASRTRNRKIEIEREIRNDPEILAVPGEIRQLLSNLVGNSIDAVGDEGIIRIRVSTATEWNCGCRLGVRVTVFDSGPGIPPAVRPKLFEPFFTTKKEAGNGLGLWACKSIVEKHSGKICVKSSVKPGRNWTAFSVFLPLSPARRQDGIEALEVAYSNGTPSG